MNKRIIVTNQPMSLYYNLQVQVENGPFWKNEGGSKMVHEDQLGDAIATVFRGPSIIPAR